MARAKPGERVIAIRDANDQTIYVFGYGLYDGNFEAPTSPFGDSWEEMDTIGKEMEERDPNFTYRRPTNPRITLDGGAGVVWGQECWWGPEGDAEKFIAGREVVIVAVPSRPQPNKGKETEDD